MKGLFHVIITKEGQFILNEIDFLNYIGQKCGDDCRNVVEYLINDNNYLKSELESIEDNLQDFYI